MIEFAVGKWEIGGDGFEGFEERKKRERDRMKMREEVRKREEIEHKGDLGMLVRLNLGAIDEQKNKKKSS